MKTKTYTQLFGGNEYPVLITSPENIFYTIGFYTTAVRPSQIGPQCVIMAPDCTWFFFPAKWEGPVMKQISSSFIRPVPYKGEVQELGLVLADTIEKMAPNINLVLGFEKDGMELNLYLTLVKHLKNSVTWTDISPALRNSRRIKSEEEIQMLRKSACLAKMAMEYIKTQVRPGMKESEVAAELEYFMRRNGSEGVPFTIKTLAGRNSAITTNLPGESRIQSGDFLLMDFGAILNNYASDWTRTFVIGRAGKKQRELYDLVWKIERSCIEMIRPGVQFHDLIDCAWNILKGHESAQWFYPYLGHSIGIQSQEWPPLVPESYQILEPNMVITIEPGIYLPELGGVRIEDEILVTENGYEILTGLAVESLEI